MTTRIWTWRGAEGFVDSESALVKLSAESIKTIVVYFYLLPIISLHIYSVYYGHLICVGCGKEELKGRCHYFALLQVFSWESNSSSVTSDDIFSQRCS